MEMNPAYRNTRFKAEKPRCPVPSSFAVITPCNPDGETVSDERNQELLNEAEEELRQSATDYFKVDGGSPDFEHVEPGFAIAADLPHALEIGQRWRQEAIFWIENDQVHLIASDGTERETLGRWSELVKFLPEEDLPSA